MRFLALATDYDGTLAHHGAVDQPTVGALERMRASGRKLIMVTGRELPELLGIFPEIHLFDWVVAENGALLYEPRSQKMKLLGETPPPAFAKLLKERGVDRVSIGHIIVATWEPFETTVLEAIRDLGLELQVIFNKGAVMVLPAGVNKASGLAAALAEMGLSPHNVVGVGDAENDHAFLNCCGCSVAVQNAIPSLKDRADLVMAADHGAGVRELIDSMIKDDLAAVDGRLLRMQVVLGRADGHEMKISPYAPGMLVAGPTGSGRSAFTVGFLERLHSIGYQFCVLDTRGAYAGLEGAVAVGTPQQSAPVAEVLELLAKPDQSVVVNLSGLRLEERQAFFQAFSANVEELRARTSRPHWMVLDDAQQLLPAAQTAGERSSFAQLERTLVVCDSPGALDPGAVAAVGAVVALGPQAREIAGDFCKERGAAPILPASMADGGAIVWGIGRDEPPQSIEIIPGRTERRRRRQAALEGDLGRDRSFYFRGKEAKLNLRAQNLLLFMQMAEGVDEETWLYHLHLGDYSRWLRDVVHDSQLAAAIAPIEEEQETSADDSRLRVRQAIEQEYAAG